MPLCLYVSMSLCLYVSMSLISMSLCLYISMSLCFYVSMSLCLYVYVSIYLCIYPSLCLVQKKMVLQIVLKSDTTIPSHLNILFCLSNLNHPSGCKDDHRVSRTAGKKKLYYISLIFSPLAKNCGNKSRD